MKVTYQSATYLPQGWHLRDIYKQIELAARTCYKSENKISEHSDEKLIQALINSQHTAMLEHGTVYLEFPNDDVAVDHDWVKYFENPYSCMLLTDHGSYAITTNFRVIIENHWEDDLQYLCEPTPWHAKRYTVRCITNLQVSHELVRHRAMSFAMESSRYCNYSNDKFGNELTFIEPIWFPTDIPVDYMEEYPDVETWYSAMGHIEKCYLQLLDYGWKPQQAAQVLPKGLKTEIVITGFDYQWNHFFDLRLREKTGPVHPQMKELAEMLANVLPHDAVVSSSQPSEV